MLRTTNVRLLTLLGSNRLTVGGLPKVATDVRSRVLFSPSKLLRPRQIAGQFTRQRQSFTLGASCEVCKWFHESKQKKWAGMVSFYSLLRFYVLEGFLSTFVSMYPWFEFSDGRPCPASSSLVLMSHLRHSQVICITCTALESSEREPRFPHS